MKRTSSVGDGTDDKPNKRPKTNVNSSATNKRPSRKKTTQQGSSSTNVNTNDNSVEKQAVAQLQDFGDKGAFGMDFSQLKLKADHQLRPIWVCPNERIFLETFSPIYKQAYDFLVAIAEPVSRPMFLHEYKLTPYSLYAAVSVGLETEDVIKVLDRLSKVELSESIRKFVQTHTKSYGKIKMVLQRNRYFVESVVPTILQRLLKDDIITAARVSKPEHVVDSNTGLLIKNQQPIHQNLEEDTSHKNIKKPESEIIRNISDAVTNLENGAVIDDDDDDENIDGEKQKVYCFEIDPLKVETVKKRCIDLDLPTLEEYDFRNDTRNPNLEIDLKPSTMIRPYQEKSLSKMFGHGRARSGIIVLPCGAGKTLVGITATCTVKKSTLVLCTSTVSVEQWRNQYKLWSNIEDRNVARFTSESKERLHSGAMLVVTTYNMIAFGGKRSEESKKIIEALKNKEWGLMVLDEVHVVPAQMFRKVVSTIASHCKLGLTATLLREDSLTEDLNFLIGPKLYEANWLDLQNDGHLAHVQCSEVWCPMTPEFYAQYLTAPSIKKQLLYVMNPLKFRCCEFLIKYHEQRGDKIIVFSDNVFALTEYATRLGKPYIYGPTSQKERMNILTTFQHSAKLNTIFISKVGDTSIDLPEATVIIQISSHFGSRRQEAQRLGRILRPKARAKGVGAKGGFNAFFYTLVSQDTSEMYYSAKRQQFLIDQGYSFRVLTSISEMAAKDTTLRSMTTRDEQKELLIRVMAADEAASRDEKLPTDKDDISNLKPKARRNAGSMNALSGSGDMYYMEYKAGSGAQGKGKAGSSMGALANLNRHHLFKKRYQK